MEKVKVPVAKIGSGKVISFYVLSLESICFSSPDNCRRIFSLQATACGQRQGFLEGKNIIFVQVCLNYDSFVDAFWDSFFTFPLYTSSFWSDFSTWYEAHS